MLKTIGRALVEIGFIVFLFYSNLLIGEFERSGELARRACSGLSRIFLPRPIWRLRLWRRRAMAGILK